MKTSVLKYTVDFEKKHVPDVQGVAGSNPEFSTVTVRCDIGHFVIYKCIVYYKASRCSQIKNRHKGAQDLLRLYFI